MTLLEQEAAVGRTPMESVDLAISQIVAVHEILPMAEEIDIRAAEVLLHECGIPNDLQSLLIARHTANINEDKLQARVCDVKIKRWLDANDSENKLSSMIRLNRKGIE